MKLQKFNGGVSTRRAPHLIGVNEGTTFQNIDIEEEILKPVNSLLAAGLTKTDEDRYIDYEDDIITLAKTPTTEVEYQNKIYHSVDGDYVQVKDSVQEGDLGLEAPEIISMDTLAVLPSIPLVGEVTLTSQDLGAASTAANIGSFHSTITYELAITQVTAAGLESAPYYVSHTPSYTNSTLTIDIAATVPLYRVYIKNLGVWRCLSYQPDNTQITEFPWWVFEPVSFPYTYSVVLSYPTWLIRYQFNYPSLPGPYPDVLWGFNTHDVENLETGAGFTAGSYTYVVTVGIASLGWESSGSALQEVILGIGEVPTFVIDEGEVDSRVDQLRIYRLGDTITDFTLVAAIEEPTFPYTFTDRVPTASIAGKSILDTEDNDKPISGLTNLAVVNGQLVGTYGSKLYFSGVGRLYAIPPGNYRDFKNTLTGVFQIDGGLLVFSATKTWLMNTSNLATGRIIQLSDKFGCLGHNTVTDYKTGAMWASQAGLCVSAGGKVEVITKDKIGYLNLQITNAVMYNEAYYGFTAAGVCYVLDLRYTPAFMTYIFSTLDDLNALTEVRQVYIDGTELKILFGAIAAVDSYTVFGATTLENLDWVSGKFIEGSYTEHKTYNDIYVRATAGITFKVLIDDVEVSSDLFYKTEVKQIKLPQNEHQGYSIQFKASGKGEVYEIEYKAMGRQNGR